MKTAIFDIDGTLSDCSARLHHVLKPEKDWDSFHNECHLDPVNEPVIEVLNRLARNGWEIAICTGRPFKFVDTTRSWLNRNGIICHNLMMREDDDFRRDIDLKRQMLKSLIDLGCDVRMAFEDRKCVVDMWREEGVFCFQCGEGGY